MDVSLRCRFPRRRLDFVSLSKMNETGNLPGAFWEIFPVAVETHMRFNETVQPRNGCETMVVHAV